MLVDAFSGKSLPRIYYMRLTFTTFRFNDIAIISTQNITGLHAMVHFTSQPDTASLEGLNNYCKLCLMGGDDDLFISFPISSLFVMMMNLIRTEMRKA